MNKRELLVKNKTLTYTLTRKKVKNLNLRVKSDGEVVVSAPYKADLARIDAFVSKNADFIFKALDKYAKAEDSNHVEHQYVTGETFRIFGDEVVLKLYRSTCDKITFDGEFLHLQTKTPNDTRKKQILIEKYFANLAFCVFKEIAEKYHPHLQKYGVAFPQIKIRKMKSRWGSCMVNKQTITLNTLLIHAPKSSIEYVVLHELCHFVHPNHSKDFYNLVATFMPDWKARKNALQIKN